MGDELQKQPTDHNAHVIERLPLEHPLPKEIQKMTKDDTVCKFCGVSYFIHHEVKALEEKVKLLEKDLVDYQATVARETDLKQKIRTIEEALAENKELIKDKDKIISKQESNLSKKIKEIYNLNEAKGMLQDEFHKELTENTTLRTQNKNMKSKLPDLMAVVGKQRLELKNVHTSFVQMIKLIDGTVSTLNTCVVSVCEKEILLKVCLQKKISSLEKEIQQIRDDNHNLIASVKNSEMNEGQLEDMEVQLVTSKDLCQQLSHQVNELQNEVDVAVGNNRTVESEAAQLKVQLRRKTQEVDDIQEQHRKQNLLSEQMFNKYQLELKQKSEELKLSNLEIKKSKQKMMDQNRIEEEIQRRAEETMHETEGMRKSLQKVKDECRALKEERELMINSHQNRIEQLRESFKQKLREAENWPEKMAEESKKEKLRHVQELKNLEESLTNSFQMEMEIEKHKCEELVEKYKDQMKDFEEEYKNEIKSICNKHKIELSNLKREAEKARGFVNEMETSYKEEISSLKNIIQNLQDKLVHIDRESDGALAQMCAELREAENDLSKAREDNQKLEEQLKNAKEEILFLQETVRKECEERFELTEALSQAREQLLSYMRPGSRSSLPSSASRSNNNSKPLSSGINQSKELGNLSNSASQLSAPHSPSNRVSASSLNIDFKSPNAKSPNSTKGGSIKDSRQRIAAAIGRK